MRLTSFYHHGHLEHCLIVGVAEGYVWLFILSFYGIEIFLKLTGRSDANHV